MPKSNNDLLLAETIETDRNSEENPKNKFLKTAIF